MLNRLTAASEYGSDVLKNPQDLCVIPDGEIVAVADDYNGLLLFSFVGVLKQHIKLPSSDAQSVCYSTYSKRLVVSVSNTDPQIGSPGELRFYKENSEKSAFELESRLQIPIEPKIAKGYIRWITAHPLSGNIYLACGDNTTAVLWKYDGKWKTILQRSGDLEHPCILAPFQTNQTTLLLNVWTETVNQWEVKKIVLDEHDKPQKEITAAHAQKIQEPWCAIAEPVPDGNVYVYDYQVGNIWKVDRNGQLGETVGAVKAGQWIGMEVYKKWLLVACSTEQCVRGFRLT